MPRTELLRAVLNPRPFSPLPFAVGTRTGFAGGTSRVLRDKSPAAGARSHGQEKGKGSVVVRVYAGGGGGGARRGDPSPSLGHQDGQNNRRMEEPAGATARSTEGRGDATKPTESLGKPERVWQAAPQPPKSTAPRSPLPTACENIT